MIRLFFIFLFLVSTGVLAQSIPLKDTVLRIVPASKTDDDLLTLKTAEISRQDSHLKIVWQSLEKKKDDLAYYPTYKVRTNRGVIETGDFARKEGFFHPGLWGSGYIFVDSFSPLWLDPEFLQVRTGNARSFNAGFLNVDLNLLRLAPDEIFQKLISFQNLYDQFVEDGEIRPGLVLKKTDAREMRAFVKGFFSIGLLAKTKAVLYVNNVRETYPAKIIGNDYYQFVVIDDPLNPLIVSFKLFPEKTPRLFKNIFTDLKDSFEFYVTQVQY